MERVTTLKTCLMSLNRMFSRKQAKTDSAFKASYVVSEMMAKTGKLFKDSKFYKQCMLQAASIVRLKINGHRPTQWQTTFLTCQVTFTINCVRKATHFHSVALNESTDSIDTAKLAIHVCAVNDN